MLDYSEIPSALRQGLHLEPTLCLVHRTHQRPDTLDGPQRLNGLGEMLMAVIQKPRNTASATSAQSDGEGEWMSLKELSALLKKHFKGYKGDEGTFRKIGNYLNRPEYKFLSKHTTSGILYWVKLRV